MFSHPKVYLTWFLNARSTSVLKLPGTLNGRPLRNVTNYLRLQEGFKRGYREGMEVGWKSGGIMGACTAVNWVLCTAGEQQQGVIGTLRDQVKGGGDEFDTIVRDLGNARESLCLIAKEGKRKEWGEALPERDTAIQEARHAILLAPKGDEILEQLNRAG